MIDDNTMKDRRIMIEIATLDARSLLFGERARYHCHLSVPLSLLQSVSPLLVRFSLQSSFWYSSVVDEENRK